MRHELGPPGHPCLPAPLSQQHPSYHQSHHLLFQPGRPHQRSLASCPPADGQAVMAYPAWQPGGQCFKGLYAGTKDELNSCNKCHVLLLCDGPCLYNFERLNIRDYLFVPDDAAVGGRWYPLGLAILQHQQRDHDKLRQGWGVRECTSTTRTPCIPARAPAGALLWYKDQACRPGWLLQPPAGAVGLLAGPGRGSSGPGDRNKDPERRVVAAGV